MLPDNGVGVKRINRWFCLKRKEKKETSDFSLFPKESIKVCPMKGSGECCMDQEERSLEKAPEKVSV